MQACSTKEEILNPEKEWWWFLPHQILLPVRDVFWNKWNVFFFFFFYKLIKKATKLFFKRCVLK